MPKQALKGMEGNWEARLSGLKEQIERGDYEVDPKAVADAILRRLGHPEETDRKAPRLRMSARNRPARPRRRGT